MPAIPIENLGEFVVKEVIRQIRNGQVKLKNLGIETEPELKVDFTCTVIVKGGEGKLARKTTSKQTNTQKSGAKSTTQDSTSDTSASENQTANESQNQGYGRQNTTNLTYEEG